MLLYTSVFLTVVGWVSWPRVVDWGRTTVGRLLEVLDEVTEICGWPLNTVEEAVKMVDVVIVDILTEVMGKEAVWPIVAAVFVSCEVGFVDVDSNKDKTAPGDGVLVTKDSEDRPLMKEQKNSMGFNTNSLTRLVTLFTLYSVIGNARGRQITICYDVRRLNCSCVSCWNAETSAQIE